MVTFRKIEIAFVRVMSLTVFLKGHTFNNLSSIFHLVSFKDNAIAFFKQFYSSIILWKKLLQKAIKRARARAGAEPEPEPEIF